MEFYQKYFLNAHTYIIYGKLVIFGNGATERIMYSFSKYSISIVRV